MATNISRPLVIQDGAQKRLPDAQKLNVGTQGIVAWDDGYKKLEIGHADNLLKEDGSDPASNHIEFLGGAKFNRDVYIQGELRVAGQSVAVDTMVTQTIFEQSVVFGDAATDSAQFVGIADFDGSIDADVTTMDVVSAGLISLDASDTSNFSVAGLDKQLLLQATGGGASQQVSISSAGTSPAAIQFQATAGGITASAQGRVQLDASSTAELTAASGNASLIAHAAQAVVQGAQNSNEAVKLTSTAGGIKLLAANVHGIRLQDAASVLKLAAGTLTDAENPLQAIDLDPAGAIALDAGASSNFSTSLGNLTFDAENGQVLIDAGAAGADALKLHASGSNGSVHILSGGGTGTLKLGNGTHELMLTGAGSLTDSGGPLASVDLDPSGAITLDAGAASRFQTDSGDLTLAATAAANSLLLRGAFGIDAEGGLLDFAAGSPLSGTANAASGEFVARSTGRSLMYSGAPAAWQQSAVSTLANNDSAIIAQDKLYQMADVSVYTANKELSLQVRNSITAGAFDGSGALAMQANSGNVTIEALAALNDADQAAASDARGGNLTLTADIATNDLKSVRSGGAMVLQAGADDLGYIHLKAGERANANWAAPDDGQIEIRAQMELRLRAAADMRLEVGVNKDAIMGDGAFVEANEVGHARIRNVKDPTHPQDVVTKKYMEQNGGGTVSLIAGEALAQGDLVRIFTDGKVFKASASSGTHYVLGVATAAAALDGVILVRMLGKFETGVVVADLAAADIGKPLYLSATSGAFVKTPPSTEGQSVQRVGFFAGFHDTDKAVVIMAIGEPVVL